MLKTKLILPIDLMHDPHFEDIETVNAHVSKISSKSYSIRTRIVLSNKFELITIDLKITKATTICAVLGVEYVFDERVAPVDATAAAVEATAAAVFYGFVVELSGASDF